LASRILGSLHRTGMDNDIRKTRQFAARLVRVVILAFMSFRANQIPVRAGALTYTTMLSVVPFAVILSAAAGRFGYLDLLSRLVSTLSEKMSPGIDLHPFLGVINYAQNVDFRQMGLVGSLALLFTFFLSMGNIELAIDHIWSIEKKRNWWRRVVEYTPFLVLLIAVLVAAGNFLLEYRDYLTPRLEGDPRTVLRHDTLFLLGNAGILGCAWSAIFLLYFLIPNTKVRFFPAALGASLATLALYGLGRSAMAFPNLFISRASYIYGSLAAVPLILLLAYLFWIVILYGAAVAFIYQRLYHVRGELSGVEPGPDGFRRVEEDVLEVLRAVHGLSGSAAVGGRRVVPVGLVAANLGREPEDVEALAAPLVDLGYLAKRRIRSGPVYAPGLPLPEVDLAAVHKLLVRLDPEGTGRLRALTALDELKHTLGILYSSEHPEPPMRMSSVIGERAPSTMDDAGGRGAETPGRKAVAET
jgi:YihY family inner membrane protein